MPALTEDQINSLRRAARNGPKDGRAYYRLAEALMMAGRFDEAADAFGESTKQAPYELAVRGNYGIALAKAGKSQEALQILLDVALRAPDVPEMHFNLGNAYRDLARPTEGAPAYARAIALRPNYPDAHWNRATALLLTEQFEEGWREFEWRFRLPGRPAIPFPGQSWNGDLSALRGRTIILAGEQGYGDVIQFARYVPLLADAGASVIVAAQTDVQSLLLTVPGIAEVIAPGDLVPRYDFVAALMSLGLLMKTTVATIPSQIPYISAHREKRSFWRERLARHASTRRVGLVWAGRPTHNNDKNRSMRLADLAPLAGASGITFFNLQKGPAAEQGRSTPPNLALVDWTSELSDWSDTAALVSELDLVITVDTAVAHLAGALGKAVWTMLPFAPDWRWMLTRPQSTPWYPTMKLFRQPARGQWQPVVQTIVQNLKEFAG
jgi:hypothetical protein